MEVVKGKVVECVEYSIEYTDNEGNGFSFYCDEEGNVKLETEAARKNYEWCREHADEFEISGEMRVRRYSYHEPDTGVCEVCGLVMELRDELYGACECDSCGQWYNLFGQPLLPPELWDE